MNIKEIGDVFHCDCGFSWHRGKNGNHNCADGLREKVRQLAAENVEIKAMNDCLSEELRGYESDGVFEGPKMHLLWWQVEFPATSAYLAGIKADAQSEVIEWLDAEITAIDTMYRGDPSYEHDASWMKSEVLGVVELARKAFPAQLREGAK